MSQPVHPGQEMELALTCPVCLTMFNEAHVPITLPCGHTVCRNFISREDGDVMKCPCCRTPASCSTPFKTCFALYNAAMAFARWTPETTSDALDGVEHHERTAPRVAPLLRRLPPERRCHSRGQLRLAAGPPLSRTPAVQRAQSSRPAHHPVDEEILHKADAITRTINRILSPRADPPSLDNGECEDVICERFYSCAKWMAAFSDELRRHQHLRLERDLLIRALMRNRANRTG